MFSPEDAYCYRAKRRQYIFNLCSLQVFIPDYFKKVKPDKTRKFAEG